jgi:hypothetical protein
MDNNKIFHKVNIVLGGDHGVGKKSIGLRFEDNQSTILPRPLIGIDFRQRKYIYCINTDDLISLEGFEDPLLSGNEEESKSVLSISVNVWNNTG